MPSFNEEDVVFEVDTSYSKKVSLPINGATDTILGSVDWGDGTVEDVVITSPSYTRFPMNHTYPDEGKYIVTFTPNGVDYSISDNFSGSSSTAFTKVYSFGTKYPSTVNFTKETHFNYFQKNYPFKDGRCAINNIVQDSVNLDGLFSGIECVDGSLSGTFTKIQGDFLGSNIQSHNLDRGILSKCSNLTEIETLNIPNETVNNICSECPNIKVIKSVTYPTNANSYKVDIVLFGNKETPNIRELTITNLSDFSAYSIIDFRAFNNWGVDSTIYKNAKQSLIDSLITNTTLRDKTLSLYLSEGTKAVLTSSEKAQITNKGFTIV